MRSCDRRRVATLLYDGLSIFEVGIVVEIFGLPRPELEVDWYTFETCSHQRGPLRTTGGVHVQARRGLRTLQQAGTIVISGWKRTSEPPPKSLLNALRSAHARGARLVSICSGAFVLAATGLLDGKRATTHWRYAEELASRFPKIRVDPGVLYVDEGSLLTSAGSAAGIDLCLHIVRCDYGAEIANRVARRLVMPPHRDGGQAQYVQNPVDSRAAGGLAPLMQWAQSRLGLALVWRIWPAARRCRRALSRASSASRPGPRLTNGSRTSVSWPRRCGSKRPTTGSMRLPKRWGYRRRRRYGSTSAGRWTRHLPPIAAGSLPPRALHRFRD